MNNFKLHYGEVLTNKVGVGYLLDQLPNSCWKDPSFTWLDIGAGTGNISKGIVERLHIGLRDSILDYSKRDKHIKEKMLYLSEINPIRKNELLEIYPNVYSDIFNVFKTFDIVVSNPPYVINGEKKVPSKHSICKKNDGRTIWPKFVDKAFSMSKHYCSLIIPSLWLRKNNGNSRDIIVSNLWKCRSLNSYNANEIFFKQGQTPVTFITLTKEKPLGVYFFDKKYIEFNPINSIFPTNNYILVKKLIPYVKQYGCIKAIKTNCPPKNVKFSEFKNEIFCFKNIKTTTLKGTCYNYSDTKLKYSYPKIVLAHKALGMAIIDEEGLGISSRDNYIIESTSERLFLFLRTQLVSTIFDSFRYRMRFLEKEAFLYLPNIEKIPLFPQIVNDDSVNSFFLDN